MTSGLFVSVNDPRLARTNPPIHVILLQRDSGWKPSNRLAFFG